MERQTIDITVRDFHEKTADALSCRIILGHVGLNICLCGSKEILALRGWHFDQAQKGQLDLGAALRDMNTVLATEAIFDYNFEEVSVFLSTPWATLVPNRLFDQTALPESYLQLLAKPSRNLKASFVALSSLDNVMVYGVEKEVLKLLVAKFPDAKISHIGHPLLLSWANQVGKRDTAAFINFSNYMVQMALFDRGQLLYFNTFSFTSPTDFLYFVLLPFNELNLDSHDVPLTLSGEITEHSALHKILLRYIRRIHFADATQGRNLPGEVLALPNHFHYDLFSTI